MTEKRVVITGIGIRTSIGDSVSQFWENCLKAKTKIESIPEHWMEFNNFSSKLWSPLEPLDKSAKCLGVNLRPLEYDESTRGLLYAAGKAIEDAGLKVSILEDSKSISIDNYKDNLGVYVGSAVSGISSFVESYLYHVKKKFSDTSFLEVGRDKYASKFNPLTTVRYIPNAPSDSLGIMVNSKKSCKNYNYSCSSSTIALYEAYEDVKRGKVGSAIVGGTEYIDDPAGAIFKSFDIVKMLTSGDIDLETSCKPLDENRNGFLFSQGGSGVVVLETLENAKERGAKIYGEILGGAEVFEAYSLLSPNPNGEPIKAVIDKALTNSNIKYDSIDYINAHATGSIVTDEIETNAINEMFPHKPFVNSTKSLIGHTFGASGIISAITTCLSIRDSKIHPTNNLINPLNNINSTNKVRNIDIRNSLIQTFGFGGHNSAIVIGKIRKTDEI